MKQKWHKLYGNYSTYFILLGLGFYYVLVIGLDVWAFCASDDVSSWIPFFLIITCPAVLTIVLAYKPQGFSRLLTRCSFDAEGIHCRSPRWGRFTLRWDEIRTYGVYGYSFFLYVHAVFVLLAGPGGVCTPKWRRGGANRPRPDHFSVSAVHLGGADGVYAAGYGQAAGRCDPQ